MIHRPVDNDFDVIVIGGGHAGAEAAWAAANLGARVALITMNLQHIGAMSCNPAIGGLAKGQMVCEIDAMGGLMARAADDTGIQFRMLNASKGPAVRGPRCQSDKYRYALRVQKLLASQEQITFIQASVDDFKIDAGRCTGVVITPTSPQRNDAMPASCGISPFAEAQKSCPNRAVVQSGLLTAGAVVLTTGTFMKGLMHTGEARTPGGRVGECAANTISSSLMRLGFELGRLKTGTPPRLDAGTIDFEKTEMQPGDSTPVPFSRSAGHGGVEDASPSSGSSFPKLPQCCCHVTYTHQAIHDLIRDNLDRAPMFNGQIETAGPRYCPSIEDKVVRFADKRSHHVFLEPESLDTNEIYCNGIPTSLPKDVQTKMVAMIPGCENARILRFGYAVEYDMVMPHQIDASAMTKTVEGLFLAGQINGTSGYEEAAGQGLIAGLNAVRYQRGEELITLRRDQAYIGVLLDDLVTKTPREPYRMFTSRAEFRLSLRADNADMRLTALARRWNLISDDHWHRFEKRRDAVAQLTDHVSKVRHEGKPLAAWLRRPECDQAWLSNKLNGDAQLSEAARSSDVIATVVADLKYQGYLPRQQQQIHQMRSQEATRFPAGFTFGSVRGLRAEAAQILSHFSPTTLGQAARLAGVTPADLMVLSIALKSEATSDRSDASIP